MAAIDKIYLANDDAIKFYHYMKSIDDDFINTFYNAETIFDFLYIESLEYIDAIKNPSVEFPVSNFPQVVDAWLLRRKDLPDFIRQKINEQYHITSSDHPMLTKALHYRTAMTGEIGNKIIIISRKNSCNKCNYAKFRYAVEVVSPEFTWYDTYLDYWDNEPEYNMYSVSSGSISSLAVTNAKSLKALIRKLKTWKFSKGTVLKVFDFGYDGEILIKVI